MDALLLETEKYVTALLNQELPSEFIYHNLGHTQRVVAAVKEIVETSIIDESSSKTLLVAAWFHDIGFIKSHKNHEQLGVDIAKDFLKEQYVTKEFIDEVCHLIMATKMDYVPLNQNEKIIRDADSSHFKDKNYREIAELLRREWQLSRDKNYNDSEWLEENISFFTRYHRYYSYYAL